MTAPSKYTSIIRRMDAVEQQRKPPRRIKWVERHEREEQAIQRHLALYPHPRVPVDLGTRAAPRSLN
jgi:hypothetical protein